jgi:Dolichyl-phosphate-mannose-protein mannosyltransferase
MPSEAVAAGQTRLAEPSEPSHESAARPVAARAAVPLLLGLGLALRFAMSYPTHAYQGNADEVLNALCAFRVMRGEFPVFFVAERLGALPGYLTALLFWLFGVSRAAMAAEPLLSGALMLGAWYLFLREALGRRLAAIALPFAAFPSPAFLFWTTMPNSYPSTLCLDALSLWLAARLARGDRSRWTVSGFGLFAGLAWWASPLSLGITLPALLWVAWHRRDLLGLRAAGRFLGGFALGALPWLAYNLRHPLASLRHTALAHPVAGWEGVLDNARFLVTVNLRELIASRYYEMGQRNPLAAALQKPVLALVGVAALTTLAVLPLWRWRYLRGRRRGAPLPAGGAHAAEVAGSADRTNGADGANAAGAKRAKLTDGVDAAGAPAALLGLVVIVVTLLNIVSAAGSDRGLPVRYLLPLYLVVPALLAPPLALLASRSRVVAAACAAAILTFNLAGANLPGTNARRLLETAARQDDQLLAFLQAQHVGALAGSYWKVYPIAFLSRERILALPMQENHDHYHFADRLNAAPLRWALVAWNPEELAAWTAHAGLRGSVHRVSPAATVFLPEPNPPAVAPAAFNLRLEAAFNQPPSPAP